MNNSEVSDFTRSEIKKIKNFPRERCGVKVVVKDLLEHIDSDNVSATVFFITNETFCLQKNLVCN